MDDITRDMGNLSVKPRRRYKCRTCGLPKKGHICHGSFLKNPTNLLDLDEDILKLIGQMVMKDETKPTNESGDYNTSDSIPDDDDELCYGCDYIPEFFCSVCNLKFCENCIECCVLCEFNSCHGCDPPSRCIDMFLTEDQYKCFEAVEFLFKNDAISDRLLKKLFEENKEQWDEWFPYHHISYIVHRDYDVCDSCYLDWKYHQEGEISIDRRNYRLYGRYPLPLLPLEQRVRTPNQ